ncbi:MAG: hypothetical protein KC708_21160 [Anaerolineae bacterium]|nr:hypothetical protein [Anaerolineae bacterium]
MSYFDEDEQNPLAQLEEQAFHAYREWPLYLKLRLRHLKQHLPREAFRREKQPDNTKTLLEDYGFAGSDDAETFAKE